MEKLTQQLCNTVTPNYKACRKIDLFQRKTRGFRTKETLYIRLTLVYMMKEVHVHTMVFFRVPHFPILCNFDIKVLKITTR